MELALVTPRRPQARDPVPRLLPGAGARSLYHRPVGAALSVARRVASLVF